MSCLSRFALVMLGVVAAGCATQHFPEQARNPNRYIYVTSASLPGQCYRDLGSIQVDEPFADAAIDPDASKVAKKIRALAVAKYPNDVDAVINLRSEQNDVGTTVTVAGEAVEIENRPTVACALRDVPPVLDSTATAAAGGIAGTVAGGLITGSTSGATNAGAVGAAATGAYEVAAHEANQEAQRQQILKQLADQQREIRESQSERARLLACQEQEVPLSSCELQHPSQARPDSANQADNSNYQNASQFELQKQVQEQQEYIAQLKHQISDIKLEMNNPTQH